MRSWARTAIGLVGIAVWAAPLLQGQGRRTLSRDTYLGQDVVEGEVLVRLRDGADNRNLYQQADIDDDQPAGNGTWHKLHSRSRSVQGLIASLSARADVLGVEPNYIVEAVRLPNDANFPSLWGLFNTTTAGADIHAPAAWEITTGSTANVVGVVDTGIDYNHPDLAANIWSAPEYFEVTVANKVIQCPAGTHGINAIALSQHPLVMSAVCNPLDDNSHGTHVAGTIGAQGNNGAGVAGVNWTTRLMALKFLNAGGSGTTVDAINAIDFAIQTKNHFAATNGANVRVLSNSWGGGGLMDSFVQVLDRAKTANMLFVAAAGNATTNIDDPATPFYPASYANDIVFPVAATTETDGLAWFSNYGATTVPLAAPGTNIYSTVLNSGYDWKSGTSMATPHVSGAAALVLSGCSLTTTQLRTALVTTVDVVPALAGRVSSGGRLNVDRALRSCATVPTVNWITPADGSIYTAPATIALAVNATDPDGIQRVDFYQGSALIGTSTTPPYAGTWNNVAAGNYTITAVARDNLNLAGTSSSIGIVVNGASPPAPLLASPWTGQDVGTPGAAGSASSTTGSFTVQGAGADIWGTADAFQFVYQPLSGDGQIVGRVASLQVTDQWAKAGVMMRENLTAGSRYVAMLVSGSNGLVSQHRTQVNGVTGYQQGPVGPGWIRVVRTGTTFDGYYSSDGVNWTLLSTDTLSVGTTVYVGLAVTSHVAGVLTTSTFDGVSVSAGAPPTGTLPSPWTGQDVGTPGAGGSATASAGTFAVQGAGADIWGTADAFQFVYQPLSGDGQIVGRVASLQVTDQWAKAGVMMRENLTAGSRYVAMLVSGSNGLVSQHRTQVNGVTGYQQGPVGPGWIRVVRTGTTFDGYYSSDGVNWTLLSTDTLSVGTTVYVGLAVTSHVAGVLTTSTFDGVSVSAGAPPTGTLPSPWTGQDVGTPGAGGSATASAGTFTVQGAGADIWGTADAFQFVHQPLLGDGQVVARVVSLQNTNSWAKAGVMIREDLTSASRYAALVVSPTSGLAFQGRLLAGGATTSSGSTGVAPIWVKLVRSGTTISGFASTDGLDWTLIGTQTTALPSTVYVGLALTSHSAGTLSTAVFDNVLLP